MSPGFPDSMSLPDEQFERIRVWSSNVLAANAKKAKRASEEARLILQPAFPNLKADFYPLKVAKVGDTNCRDTPSEKVGKDA